LEKTMSQSQISEEAFRERVVASHGGNEHGRAYMEAIEFAHRLAGIYAPPAAVE
jgi:alpha-beta hydrolase superfamily lysophospholipase